MVWRKNLYITFIYWLPGIIYEIAPCGCRPCLCFGCVGWHQKKHRFNVCWIEFLFLIDTNASPDLEKIPNESARFYTKKYLGVGELVFDYSSAYLGSSEYFKRSWSLFNCCRYVLNKCKFIGFNYVWKNSSLLLLLLYSTVTDLAKFLGKSTSMPLFTANQ